MRAAVLPLILVSALAGCGPRTESMGRTRGAPPSFSVTSDLVNPSGEVLGRAVVTQERDGVRIVADVNGLPAGDYAMHLHAIGRCEAPAFTSAGPHFNPDQKQHGRLNPMGEHAGDLPNLTVGADRRGRLEADRPGLMLRGGAAPLLDTDGAALVLHAAPDDYRSDPAGNAGTRIACAVLAGPA